jgi:hypothetical protein
MCQWMCARERSAPLCGQCRKQKALLYEVCPDCERYNAKMGLFPVQPNGVRP